MEDWDVENFINSYKRSIKIVRVTINGNQISLPITYSMNASIKYQDGYKHTNDYRSALCIMILEIINHNKKFVDENNDISNLNIDDIINMDDIELKRIGKEILNCSKYLNEIEEGYIKIDNFFEKFYLINKKEAERYKETLSKVVKPFKRINISPNSLKLLNQVSRISNTLDWANQKQELLRPVLGIASTFNAYNKTFEIIQRQNNLFRGTNQYLFSNMKDLGSSMRIISDDLIKYQNGWSQFASSILKWSDIYNPTIIKSMQNIALQESAIRKVLYNPLNQFESTIKGITTINAYEKVLKFTSLQEQIISKFKPFIIDLQSIRIQKLLVKQELNERAEILKRFGWWYISDIPEEIINDIMEGYRRFSQNDVDQIICDFFKENDFSILDEMLDRWSRISFMERRYTLFEEAIYLHKNRMYVSSIQNLITNAEGIIRNFVRETCGFANKGWVPTYSKFKSMINELEDFLYEYFISFIDYLYMNFDPKYPEKTDDFNRHKIMHGESLRHGTEVNSLKTILYINEIYHILNTLTDRRHYELIGVI